MLHSAKPNWSHPPDLAPLLPGVPWATSTELPQRARRGTTLDTQLARSSVTRPKVCAQSSALAEASSESTSGGLLGRKLQLAASSRNSGGSGPAGECLGHAIHVRDKGRQVDVGIIQCVLIWSPQRAGGRTWVVWNLVLKTLTLVRPAKPITPSTC